MKTVLMAIAIIRDGDKILLRKVDPDKNPYNEPWALFGSRIDGEGKIDELINTELNDRWDMKVSIEEKLWWDEEIKTDHDGEAKHFIYLDALCRVTSGTITPANKNEHLEWVEISDIGDYSLNPPSVKVLQKLITSKIS